MRDILCDIEMCTQIYKYLYIHVYILYHKLYLSDSLNFRPACWWALSADSWGSLQPTFFSDCFLFSLIICINWISWNKWLRALCRCLGEIKFRATVLGGQGAAEFCQRDALEAAGCSRRPQPAGSNGRWNWDLRKDNYKKKDDSNDLK